jgi:hypothetical protein
MCKSGRLYKFSYCVFLLIGLLLSSVPAVRGETLEKDEPYEFRFLDYLKGKPTENQIFIGMFTYHFDPKSRESRNWKQNLIGLQYNDFFICTFENSFYIRTWAAGIARTLHAQALSNHWDMATGYRMGVVYGYEEGQAPFSNVSPVIPVVELYIQSIYRKHFGVELMLTSSISIGFFYQF